MLEATLCAAVALGLDLIRKVQTNKELSLCAGVALGFDLTLEFQQKPTTDTVSWCCIGP